MADNTADADHAKADKTFFTCNIRTTQKIKQNAHPQKKLTLAGTSKEAKEQYPILHDHLGSLNAAIIDREQRIESVIRLH